MYEAFRVPFRVNAFFARQKQFAIFRYLKLSGGFYLKPSQLKRANLFSAKRKF
jgi:hypothetical protein